MGKAKEAIMRNSSKLAATIALALAATLAQAGPPPPGWGPVGPGYRPPVVVGPAYPGWRPGWGAGYWGPGYWGPRVVITTPGVVGPWPYGWSGAYPVPYAVPYGVPYAMPYATPPVVVSAAPAAAAPETSFWYYCSQPAGYYPYVKDCSQPWMKVVPQQPGETATPPRLAP